MSGEQTLRAIHERCKARHRPVDRLDTYGQSLGVKCDHCGWLREWPCEDYSDAVAALNLLSALEDELATQRDRAEGWKRRYAFMESHPSYIPDPLPSGSSMPATPHETKETTT